MDIWVVASLRLLQIILLWIFISKLLYGHTFSILFGKHLERNSCVMWWSESHSVVTNSLRPHELYSPGNSPGQNTGVGITFFFPGDLPNPGIKLRSPTLQADSLPAEPPGKPVLCDNPTCKFLKKCQTVFQGGCSILIFSLAMYEDSSFSPFSSTLIIPCLFLL